jgi:hypothetical protein
MANKTKPAKSKRHQNPKGRVALFCYVKPETLAIIKRNVRRSAGWWMPSQGHVIDYAVACFHGSYKRPIA